MRLTLLSLVVFAGINSCKKDKLDINAYWQCNQSQNLDTTAISGKLIGRWTWSKQTCYLTGETKSANRNVRVTFNADHTYSINDNSTTMVQGTWKIMQLDGNSSGLDISTPHEYLYGRILFCGNQLLLNDSFRDGCDNLFDKSN